MSPRVLVVLLVLAVGACGGDDEPVAQSGDQPTSAATAVTPSAASPTATPTPSPSPSTAPGTVVTTADTEFGKILFDGTGQAIYLFDKEETSDAECYDDCADEWPPVLTDGDPVADGDVAPDQLGTTKRTDGSTQVTYAGHPLYYYAHEGENQVKCHNVHEFGGLWLVVTPDGNAAAA